MHISIYIIWYISHSILMISGIHFLSVAYQGLCQAMRAQPSLKYVGLPTKVQLMSG